MIIFNFFRARTEKRAKVVQEMMDNGGVIIDVRSPLEYKSGHVEKARNIPHATISQGLKKLKVKKDRPVILYCQSGGRASQAQSALEDAGYFNTYNAKNMSKLNRLLSFQIK